MDKIVIVLGISAMGIYYYFVLCYAKRILEKCTESRWDCAIIAAINVALHYLAYTAGTPYELILLSGGVVLLVEFKIISKATVRQLFFGASVFTFNIILINVLTLVCVSHLSGIPALQIYNDKTLFLSIILLEYLVLIFLLKFISAIVPLAKIRGMSNTKIYSEVMSLTAAVMVIYQCVNAWVSLTYEIYFYYLVSTVVSVVIMAVAFYCLFFFNLQLITLHSLKRKSDRVDILQKKNIEKQLKVEKKLYTDQLTGCYNRLFIEQKLDEIAAGKEFFGVVYSDLAALKYVNDNFGHKEGDRYITTIADVLVRSVRSKDFVARVGGDEFIILLRDIAKSEIETVIARIRKNTKEENENCVFEMHANLGYVYIDADSDRNKLHILERADRLMQEDKRIYYAKGGA